MILNFYRHFKQIRKLIILYKLFNNLQSRRLWFVYSLVACVAAWFWFQHPQRRNCSQSCENSRETDLFRRYSTWCNSINKASHSPVRYLLTQNTEAVKDTQIAYKFFGRNDDRNCSIRNCSENDLADANKTRKCVIGVLLVDPDEWNKWTCQDDVASKHCPPHSEEVDCFTVDKTVDELASVVDNQAKHRKADTILIYWSIIIVFAHEICKCNLELVNCHVGEKEWKNYVWKWLRHLLECKIVLLEWIKLPWFNF